MDIINCCVSVPFLPIEMIGGQRLLGHIRQDTWFLHGTQKWSFNKTHQTDEHVWKPFYNASGVGCSWHSVRMRLGVVQKGLAAGDFSANWRMSCGVENGQIEPEKVRGWESIKSRTRGRDPFAFRTSRRGVATRPADGAGVSMKRRRDASPPIRFSADVKVVWCLEK